MQSSTMFQLKGHYHSNQINIDTLILEGWKLFLYPDKEEWINLDGHINTEFWEKLKLSYHINT